MDTPNIGQENVPIGFKQYLEMTGGSGIIYEEECRGILQGWKTADWIRVDEFISPIVCSLLVDAAETNRPLYEKIMSCVMEVYPELKKDLGFTPERPKLTRIK